MVRRLLLGWVAVVVAISLLIGRIAVAILSTVLMIVLCHIACGSGYGETREDIIG